MKKIVTITWAVLLFAVSISPGQALAGRVASSAGAGGDPPLQYWRMGFTLQPSPTIGSLTGRVVSVAAEMQSSKSQYTYFAFPATAIQRVVQAARFNILTRSGAYSGAASLYLAVFTYPGVMVHTVSYTSVPVQTAALNTWTNLVLTGNIANRLIEPGEFLAFCFALDGAPGGNLDVRPVFEVAVAPLSLQMYLPIVRR
jgi:hypothetical protein